MPALLRRLLAGVSDLRVSGDPDVLITSISIDSRRIERGALFACLRGLHDDGHAHAAEAVAAGAAAVLAERDLDIGSVPLVAVPSVLAALSPIAAELWGRPSSSLACVGVTGTNGKTTTTHVVEAIARCAGRPYGLIGTLGARLGDTFSVNLEHTTPYAHDLQALLARFRAAGAGGAVLEVSSHALAMHRVDDVEFDVAALTNVTHDHLDFHGNFEEYAKTKRRLFELARTNRSKRPGICVLNLDDAEGRRLAAEIPAALTYSVNNPDAALRATDVELFADGSRFFVPALRQIEFMVRLPGPFNVANAMAAIAIATALDFDVEAIADGLLSIDAVPGRMTQVPAERIGVYVDYAHTPDGLRNVLQAARALTQYRVVCVFGCGGDRDPLKRPVMGRIARELSDHVVLTSDNPRFEDPASIIADVLAGTEGEGAQFTVEPDRAKAIESAIASAKPGDVVVIAGKGHEAYQLVRGERLPFSDVRMAEAAIRKVGA
ncbi:MAG: UDP-N-acetylmuramoyl-L-alanyl-D-glutamate--2,6-diaminopimelate ligase [Candidatus Eremiobacteraeota bacterium]|nr:UDP-N-acetylmuramoyl-L-alanyl-D-glutamate--2,6-diaminopimelate ligase [Candidatus Eremiobacteraeota bacterium]